MPYRPSNRAGIHPLGIPLMLVAFVVIAALGAAAEALVVVTPFRWVAPIYGLIAWTAVGAVLVGMYRVGRVRGVAVAATIAVLAPLTYFGGVVGAAYAMAPEANQSASGALGVFFERYGDGLRMSGGVFDPGGFRIAGIWLALLWVLEAVIVLLVAFVVGGVENQRAYCERCARWAGRRRWTFGLRPMGGEVDLDRGLDGILIHGTRAGSTSERLEYAINSCGCGAAVTLEVTRVGEKTGEGSPSETQVVEPHLMTAEDLARLFAWAEAIDPMMASARPSLSPAPERIPDEARLVARENSAVLPELARDAAGEVIVRVRWGGSVYQNDYDADTNQSAVLRKLLGRGEYDVVSDVIGRTADATTRGIFVEATACWNGIARPVESWCGNRPASSEARLARGVWLVKHAWHARGGDWVPKNHELFRSRLAEAERALLEAAEMNGSDGVTHAWLVLCAMGLGRGTEASVEHFKESVRRQPTLRQAHTFLVQALSSKWGGKDEKMLEFARRAAGRAGAGSTIPSVLAEAHIEYAGAIAREKNVPASDYLTKPEVQAELLAASRKVFPVNGGPPSMDAARAREVFANALWRAGLFEDALGHLTLLPKQPPFHHFQLRWLFLSGRTRSAAIRACRARRLPTS